MNHLPEPDKGGTGCAAMVALGVTVGLALGVAVGVPLAVALEVGLGVRLGVAGRVCVALGAGSG